MFAGLIVLAMAAAFSSSFAGSLVFDDNSSISQNATIRQLWPIWKPLSPSRTCVGVGGRPLLNLSLAINYAISGYGVWSYHVVNLAIHILAALLLFGVVRRTLLLPTMRDRWGAAALPLGFVIALLWAVHPLQSESVTYIVQRAESLMGLLYFLTLYCFIRGASVEGSGVRGQGSEPDSHPSSFVLPPVAWYVGSMAACLLGMASKEVMVSAPLIVLLYDRTFCAGSFREALRRRCGLYLALAGTWILLGWLVLALSPLGTSTGPGTREFTWSSYLLTQPGVIVHYLRLAVWPSGLCLEYGWPPASTVAEVLLPTTVVGGLFAATVCALRKRSAWGFLGVWFFAILAPTSSFVPLGQAAFEHRMYLPLAAVVTGLVVGGFLAGRWLVRRGKISLLASQVMAGALTFFASVALGILTFQRNLDYRSELSIWEDTVAKAPNNHRAHNNLGNVLVSCGRPQEAVAQYRKALEIKPDFAEAHNNLGNALTSCGRPDEAIAYLRKALEFKPDFADAHYNLGNALASRGQPDEAIAEYQKALEIDPDYAEAHYNIGTVLAKRGLSDEAIAEYQKALEIRPDYAKAHYNLGNSLAGRGRPDEAIVHYRKALQIKPDYAEAYNNLGVSLGGSGRFDAAIAHFNKALELNPDYTSARNNLGIVQSRREALLTTLAQQRESLRSRPNDVTLLNDIAWTLATNPNTSIRNGRTAVELAQRAVELSEGREPAILGTLAAAYAEAGRFSEAVQTARKARELATERNQLPLAESLKTKIPLYEAKTPFRDTPQASAGDSTLSPSSAGRDKTRLCLGAILGSRDRRRYNGHAPGSPEMLPAGVSPPQVIAFPPETLP